ncbi:MAG: hypothetical protein EPN49_02415 [Rhodanobacter sp.]|nr:MAG: hypothetical protein EPN49_02415 [Rhodanobacter sp.]
MEYITIKKLQRKFGLPWMVCEQIIRGQTGLIRNRWNGLGALLGGMYLGGMLWSLGAFGWLLPGLPPRWELLLRLPGIVLLFFSRFVLPRLLAGNAILAAASAHVDRRCVGAPMQ